MMEPGMATEAGSTTARPALRRDRERGVLAGVCAGIAARLDVDPLVVRIAFVAAAAAGGAGFFLYALGWLVMPAGDSEHVPRAPTRGGRGSVEVALGVALLLLAALLALRAVDVWFPDAVVWPLVLIAGGGALLWRRAGGDTPPPPSGASDDLAALGRGAAVVSRVGLGIALVIAAGLARRQERELRSWLSGRSPSAAAERMAGALEQAAAEVEESSGVPVDVVAVGDCDLDPRADAMVAAAREAMLNAAKFGNGATVDVFAELATGRKHVFVRDRGPGFDPDAVPADRRGVRESIVGRMARNGGRAAVHSQPGGGTEVELVLESDP
jgi:phage shock protein PspC (stress-responsive transcriptional regulator)